MTNQENSFQCITKIKILYNFFLNEKNTNSEQLNENNANSLKIHRCLHSLYDRFTN